MSNKNFESYLTLDEFETSMKKNIRINANLLRKELQKL